MNDFGEHDTDIKVVENLSPQISKLALNRRNFLLGAGAAAGSVVLLGCSSSVDTAAVATTSTTAPGPTTPTYAPVTEVVFGLSGDPDTLDPHTTIAGNAWVALANVFDGLVMVDYASPETPPPLLHGLAESFVQSADGTTFNFKLRENVTFHDQTPWNSEAALFNFRRWFDEGFEYYYPLANSTVAGFIGGIQNYDAASEFEFVVQLEKPNAGWFDYLGRAPTFYMVSPDAVKASGNEGFADVGIGTGPFVVESYTRGTELVLTRNEDYWNGAPEIERLIFVPVADEPTKVSNLVTGAFQIAHEMSPDSFAQVEASPDLRIEFAGKPVTFGFAGHMGFEPWSDPRVREAFSLAINRDAIANGLLRGAGVPATQFYGLGNSAYDPTLVGDPFDLDRAATLLEDAGIKDLVVSIKTSTSAMGVPTPARILEQVQADLGQIGVKMEITTMEWTSYLDEWYLGVPEPEPGAPMKLLSQAMGWDTNMLLGAYVGSGGQPLPNFAWYESAEVDSLLEAANASTTPEGLIVQLRAAQKAMMSDRPYIYIFHGLSPYGIHNAVDWTPGASWAQNLRLARSSA